MSAKHRSDGTKDREPTQALDAGIELGQPGVCVAPRFDESLDLDIIIAARLRPDNDEFNRHVNYIAAVAQHFMLLEALKNRLNEERMAIALDLSIESIRLKRDMLNGICPEAVQLLMNRSVSPQVFAILRKMKAIRQIEAAEHMVAGATYSIPFAKALLAVTKPEMLEEHPSSRQLEAISVAARSFEGAE